MDHKTLKMKREVKKVNTISVPMQHESLIGLSKKDDRRRAQLLFSVWIRVTAN